MTSPRRRYLLLPVLALLALFAFGVFEGPVLAQSPAVGASPVSSVGPAASPGVTGPPCPNPTHTPGPSLLPGQSAPPTRAPNLCPAQLGADPFSLIAWALTPIFQAIFLGLAFIYNLIGDIGIAIIVVTLVLRFLMFPIYRKQMVSMRRTQELQPEIKAIQQKYKGDRQKISSEQMRLYQQRGVNPASGCLPTLLTMFFLFPMYSVFSSGLSAPNISSMLTVFGVQVVHIACQPAAATGLAPCINTTVHWLGDLNASRPEILFTLPIPGVGGFGVSVVAVLSSVLQLVQTRMMMPPSADPSQRSMQRTMLLLPLISVVYGSFLPAGLFIYWIVTTIFSIVQQYLVVGWGSFFPLFGWTPSFARDHTPRFAIAPVPPRPGVPPGDQRPDSSRTTEDRAAGTVRPNKSRARTSRRGRRR